MKILRYQVKMKSAIYSLLLISSGIGRTGVFIALSNLIDQIITEGVVNVYQTAKRMRQQRSCKILTRVRIVLYCNCLQYPIDSLLPFKEPNENIKKCKIGSFFFSSFFFLEESLTLAKLI